MICASSEGLIDSLICRIGRVGSGEIQPVSDARLLAAWVGISPPQNRTPDRPDRTEYSGRDPLLEVTTTVRDNARRAAVRRSSCRVGLGVGPDHNGTICAAALAIGQSQGSLSRARIRVPVARTVGASHGATARLAASPEPQTWLSSAALSTLGKATLATAAS